MQEIPGLVSIVIPAYNAASFIADTLESVKEQTYTDWELIVVNDGSTDNTGEVVTKNNGSSYKLLNQQNAGVSSARNKGLANASGEFIVFFDADDIMSPDFLKTRVDALRQDETIDFAGGLVETFPVKTRTRRAVSTQAEKEILFYDPACVTIPSNYMFRKKAIVGNRIFFNENLESTADRFFLLEMIRHVKGKALEQENGKLLYRVSQTSMSNTLNLKLVLDTEKFYYELKKRNFLPVERKRFQSFYFFSLALSFLRVKRWPEVIKYLGLSFFNHPGEFSRFIGRKFKRT
jgi:teichuronic acid biosynthesis glycosyltransferase TuaG